MPPPSPPDADKAWNDMLGKPSAPAKPAAPAAPSPSTPSAPASPSVPHTPPIASAAKWGAVAVLGIVAIVAVVWVILSNRTRPAIVPAPPSASANETPAPTAHTPPAQTGGSLLDINTATAAQLEHLPGIGPAIAARIIADRTKHGKYTSVDQLDRVEGIGPKTLDKLRPYLTVK